MWDNAWNELPDLALLPFSTPLRASRYYPVPALSFLGSSHSSVSHAEQRHSFTANHSYNKFTSQGRTGKHPYWANYKENKYFSQPSRRSKLSDDFSLDFVEFEEFKSADLTLTCSLALIDGVFLGLVTFVPNKRKKVVLLKQIKDSWSYRFHQEFERNSPKLRLILLHQTFIVPHWFSNAYNVVLKDNLIFILNIFFSLYFLPWHRLTK